MNAANNVLLNAGSPSIFDQEGQLAIVLANIAVVIFMFDSEANLLFANQAGHDLFGAHELPAGQKLPPDSSYEALQQLLDDARHSRTSLSGEIVWSDNRIFSTEIFPTQTDTYIVTLYDVSRFKEIEKKKNEYFATAVHDLRSPITSIIGFSHLMIKAGTLNASQSGFVQRVQQIAIHMNNLLEEVLYLTKFDLDAESKKEVVDISRLFFQIATEFQPQTALKRQVLAFEKTEGQINVSGNESQLRRVLRNLIGNAVKYTPEGGAVTLSLELDSNMVKIRIKDTGYGIPASDLPYIFERFYRVYKNGRDNHNDIEGNGLGLAIVKTIAEQHGGNISVDSEVGKGSCFTFTIPLFSAHPA